MKRIYSLDVLRGIAITIMLFLDAPPEHIYSILMHAPWTGLTIPDVALPMFAFAMGTSAAISMSRRKPSTRKILRRAVFMFAIGIFLNVLPQICALFVVDGYGISNFVDAAFVHGRLFGIIQRLALTYALGIFIVSACRHELGILIAAVVLLIVSSAGFHIYAPENPFDETHNISRAVDYLFPGENHIYTPTHDPEGLYGTLAGTASVLFGFLAGKILLNDANTRKQIFVLAAAGILTLIAGGLWTIFDPVSKKLWTASFTLINVGLDFLILALLTKLFDALPNTKNFLQPLAALGTNPLFFFVANNVVIMILYMFPDAKGGIYLWLYRHTTQGFISPEFGATLFCVLWCLLWLPIAETFYRMRITIKL